MSVLNQARWILAKDLKVTWRRKGWALSVVLFALLVVVVFSFAVGPNAKLLKELAGGLLAFALLSASILTLNESFRQEEEERGLLGLRLLGVSPVAVFLGKALANALILLALGPPLIVASIVFFDLTPRPGSLVTLALLWVLTASGLAAPGTLYAAMSNRTVARDVLLPVLLFPLVVPVLLGSSRAFGLALEGDPMGQLGSWIGFLAAFNAVYWLLGAVLFSTILEDGRTG